MGVHNEGQQPAQTHLRLRNCVALLTAASFWVGLPTRWLVNMQELGEQITWWRDRGAFECLSHIAAMVAVCKDAACSVDVTEANTSNSSRLAQDF